MGKNIQKKRKYFRRVELAVLPPYFSLLRLKIEADEKYANSTSMPKDPLTDTKPNKGS
jgi:hypothetical protein